jgi:hypothetical protein
MHETSTLIVYDPRDPQQWEKAGRDRQAWGPDYKAHRDGGAA